MEKLSIDRHCELCRAWGFKYCPYPTVEECDRVNNRNSQEEEIRKYAKRINTELRTYDAHLKKD